MEFSFSCDYELGTFLFNHQILGSFVKLLCFVWQEKDQILMDTLETIAQRRAEKGRENAKR